MSVERRDVKYVVEIDGNLMKKRHPGGQIQNRLIACPLCGVDFGEFDEPPDHIEAQHGPEDAGLTPLSSDVEGQSSVDAFGGEQA